MHCHNALGQWVVELLQCEGPTRLGEGESCPGGGRCRNSAPRGIHCLTAWVKLAVRLLQYTASLPGGCEKWDSCCTLPHCLRAAGSAISAMHRHIAWWQWAGEILQCTASLLGDSAQCNSYNTLPHCLGTVGTGTPTIHCHNTWGSALCNSCSAPPHRSGKGTLATLLPHCLRPMGSATAAMQCHTAGCGGQWNSRNVRVHQQGGQCPAHKVVAAERAELLQCTATLPGRSGQWNSCHTLPNCLGAMGTAILAIHRPVHGASGQWNSCNALPLCLGAVGRGTSATHCLTAYCPQVVRQCIAGVPDPTASRP